MKCSSNSLMMKLWQHMRHFLFSTLVLLLCPTVTLSPGILTRQSVERKGLLRFETRAPEYHSIIMLEPFDWRNQRAFAYDMHTHSIRQECIDKARDSVQPQVTEIITLLQEIETNGRQAA